MTSRLDGRESVTIAVFQLPGSNALATAERVRREMDSWPAASRRASSTGSTTTPTVFVEESIREVVEDALRGGRCSCSWWCSLFLQQWRATLVPMAGGAGLAGRHLRRDAAARLLAQQPLAVRPRARDRDRGRRRDRGGRERGALDLREGLSAREATRKAMREVTRAGDRHRAGPGGGVRADGLHHRDQRAVLPAVRPHDRGEHRDLEPSSRSRSPRRCARSSSPATRAPGPRPPGPAAGHRPGGLRDLAVETWRSCGGSLRVPANGGWPGSGALLGAGWLRRCL